MAPPIINPETSATWVETVAIAAGASGLSPEIDLGGGTLVAISIPPEWVTADITLMAADAPGGTYRDVYDDAGVEVKLTVGAPGSGGKIVAVSSAAGAIATLRAIKLRSGTTALAVNQTGAPTVKLLLKG